MSVARAQRTRRMLLGTGAAYLLLAWLSSRAGDYLAAIQLLYVLPMVYGMLRLDRVRLAGLTAFALITHGTALFMLVESDHRLNQPALWAQFAALALAFAWSGYAAGSVLRLRERLAEARRTLARHRPGGERPGQPRRAHRRLPSSSPDGSAGARDRARRTRRQAALHRARGPGRAGQRQRKPRPRRGRHRAEALCRCGGGGAAQCRHHRPLRRQGIHRHHARHRPEGRAHRRRAPARGGRPRTPARREGPPAPELHAGRRRAPQGREHAPGDRARGSRAQLRQGGGTRPGGRAGRRWQANR